MRVCVCVYTGSNGGKKSMKGCVCFLKAITNSWSSQPNQTDIEITQPHKVWPHSPVGFYNTSPLSGCQEAQIKKGNNRDCVLV